MSFLRRVAGLSLRDRVRSTDIRRELGLEPLLLHVERSQLRCFGHLIRMPPGQLPLEVFWACPTPTGKRPWGRPRTRWDFHAQPSLGFTENGPKKRKYPVSGSSLGENEVRGEWQQ